MDAKMDVTKISGLFPNTHMMFSKNIFSEISEKIAGTVPAILIFTNSIRIFIYPYWSNLILVKSNRVSDASTCSA